MYRTNSQVHDPVFLSASSQQQIDAVGNLLNGAGSELIKSELGAYGEKILGSGSDYVRSNVSIVF